MCIQCIDLNCLKFEGYTERDVSSMMTSFLVTGLQPGEIYGLTLKTKVKWVEG